MTITQRLGVAILAVLLLGGITGSAQNTVPGPDQAGLFAAVTAMRAEMNRAIETSTRAQVLIARLASQDARITAVTIQVVDAQRAVWDAMKSRIDTETEIRRLTQILPGTQPQARTSTPQEVSEQRVVLGDREREEQAARTRLLTLQKSLDAEQTKRAELHGRLDELERSLPPGRR